MSKKDKKPKKKKERNPRTPGFELFVHIVFAVIFLIISVAVKLFSAHADEFSAFLLNISFYVYLGVFVLFVLGALVCLRWYLKDKKAKN